MSENDLSSRLLSNGNTNPAQAKDQDIEEVAPSPIIASNLQKHSIDNLESSNGVESKETSEKKKNLIKIQKVTSDQPVKKLEDETA